MPRRIADSRGRTLTAPHLWDGAAAERIVDVLAQREARTTELV